jgi:hypothetical protein
MYIVISKPKRMSVKAGVVHCIQVSPVGWHEKCLAVSVHFGSAVRSHIMQNQCHAEPSAHAIKPSLV